MGEIVSPEFENYWGLMKSDKVPAEVKTAVRLLLGRRFQRGRDFRRMVQEGFLVLVQRGGDSQVLGLDEATDGQIRNAHQAKGDWYLVHGTEDTHGGRARRRSLEKRFSGARSDEVTKKGHSRPKAYRGKHRSENKGAGIRAFFRRPPFRRK